MQRKQDVEWQLMEIMSQVSLASKKCCLSCSEDLKGTGTRLALAKGKPIFEPKNVRALRADAGKPNMDYCCSCQNQSLS